MSADNATVLVLEPRARFREALVEAWGVACGGSLPHQLRVEQSGGIRGLSRLIHQETFEACVIPLVPQHRSVERFWHDLEEAGYDIGYLFHISHAPSKAEGKAPPRGTYAPYLCQTRFGCHKKMIGILRHIDPGVLEVRPTDKAPHERYRKILNRVTDGYWEVGPDLHIAYANSAFRSLVKDSDPVGHSLLEYFEDEDRPLLRSIMADQREGIIIPFTVRLKGPQGKTVNIDPSPRFDGGGKYLGGSAILREASPQSDTAAEMLERERALYTLFTVTSTLARVSGLQQLVAAATERVRLQLGVDATCTWVKDESGGMRPIEPFGLNTTECPQLFDLMREWCQDLPANKPADVVRDVGRIRSPLTKALADLGFSGMAAIPLQAERERIGFLWLACHDGAVMNRAWVSLLISIGHQFGLAIANSMGAEARLREEERRKKFYREAVYALTNGKLSLLEKDEVAEVMAFGEVIVDIAIQASEDVQTARRRAEEALATVGFVGERTFDIATCVSEAATNTLLHGCGGLMRISRLQEEDGIRFSLQDKGPGINFSELPKALLKRGYSTTVSMGLGYTLILEMMDAIYLSTDSGGTTLVMDALRNPPNTELEAWLAKVPD